MVTKEKKWTAKKQNDTFTFGVDHVTKSYKSVIQSMSLRLVNCQWWCSTSEGDLEGPVTMLKIGTL